LVHDIFTHEILRQVLVKVPWDTVFTTLENGLLNQLLLRRDLRRVLVKILEGTWSLKIKCTLSVERLLRKVAISIFVFVFIIVELPIVLFKAIISEFIALVMG
jgi:hypothetical protein